MARFEPKLFVEQSGTPKKHEERIADHVNGRRQPGSGASDYAKGDVKASNFLIECKMTGKASIRVTGHWLAKITKEAMAAGKEPALAIEIAGHDDPVLERDWVMVPMSVFKRFADESE
jgi:Holliday junction resolvase